ncbi:MAG: hypothetical protein K1V86_05875 [Duncaniella sp.]|nr:hypothetical protein EEL51_02480 [Muribaculaceae bacterium Isolate-110 (HZI)]
MSTISCQNQNEIDELITTSVTDDIPIKSLPPTSRGLMQVTNGYCVIGVIQYCGRYFGLNIPEEDIQYKLKQYACYSDNTLYGFNINSQEWNDALELWFDITYPAGQTALIKSVVSGNIACCRLSSDNGLAHAVVLVGVDASKYQFLYYDPVLGGFDNRISFSKVYDPRIINSLKSDYCI